MLRCNRFPHKALNKASGGTFISKSQKLDTYFAAQYWYIVVLRHFAGVIGSFNFYIAFHICQHLPSKRIFMYS